MTSSTTVEQYAEAAVTTAARGRGDADWLVERRADAARAFNALPMPTPALRPWRYTQLAGLDPAGLAPAAPKVTIEGVSGGVTASALAGDVARERLGVLLPATESRFLAANAAQWSEGVLVHAPRGATGSEPLLVTLDATGLEDVAVYPRVLIAAEEQSDITVVLRVTSGDARLVAASVIEVYAGRGARVKLLLDDQWGKATTDFAWIRARLDRDSDVQIASIAMGGALVKQTIEVMLEGEGATSGIRAVALGDANQHFDFVTLQDHIGPHTTSLVEVKAALAGTSRSAYYGITRVGEGAAGADADQTNRNLLLSDGSKADSDPVLEILTANVIRCGHHAAVGPVDSEALFYLQSRGLDTRQALQQLVSGFFHSVVGEIQLANLSEELTERVMAKLATAEL